MDKEQQAALKVLFEVIQRKAEPEDIDPTLTARNIVHALDGLSSHWEAIGEGLNIHKNILLRTANEFSDDDRRLLEVILHWLSSNTHCTWGTIKHVVTKLKKYEYIAMIELHQQELKRILLHSKSMQHCRQLLPKNDTSYEECWLKRVEFEPDPLLHSVFDIDQYAIYAVINKYNPTKWKMIGQDLGLPKSELDKIEIDEYDTETRLQRMISTWILFDDKCTWQELVHVLRNPKYNKAAADAMIEVARNRPKQHTGVPNVEKKIYKWINTGGRTWQELVVLHNPKYNKAAADAMIGAARNRPKQQHTGVPSVEKIKYEGLHDHQEKEQRKSEKVSATKILRRLLNVASTVSDENLVEDLAGHLKKANLTQDQLKEVVRAIEILEQTMKEYSNEFQEWRSNLKKNIETAEKFKTELTHRHQKLLKLQKHLEQLNETINTKFFNIHKESSFLQKTITTYRLQDYRLETEDKLKYVNDKIRSSLTEIEHANTDYRTISYKLNECQIELETCVEVYKRFHSAIEEVSKENLPNWYNYTGGAIGASMGAAVGGVTGSAVGPLGTVTGVAIGLGVGVHVGGALGVLTGFVYGERNREQKDQCNKLIESCATCVEELEKSTHKLQKIQDQLNEAKKSF